MMQLAQTVETASVGPVPDPVLSLYQNGDLVARHLLPPGQQLVFGRIPECDVRLPHASVSRTHMRIHNDDGQVLLEDLGTVHGTWVDGDRTSGPITLADGARIELGRSSSDGFEVRLEDPSTGLLRQMGLLPEIANDEEATQRDSPAADDDESDLLRLADSSTLQSTASNTATHAASGVELAEIDTTVAGPEDETNAFNIASSQAKPARLPSQLLRSPFVWAGLALASVLAVAVFLVVRPIHPAALGWRWVHLSPPEIAAGSLLSLDSPDIREGSLLTVTLGDAQVVPRLMNGRVELDVPELEAESRDLTVAGRYGLPLVVVKNDIEVFRATLSYLVPPKVESLVPASVEVGETFEIRGSRFGNGSDLAVRVGEIVAEVLDATDRRLLVRAPDTGRDRTMPWPVIVQVGRLPGRSPTTLEIRVPPPAPAQPLFQARRQRGQWQIVPAIGPALVYGSKEAASRAERAWNRLFALLPENPTVELATVSHNGRYSLTAIGRSLTEPIVLGNWGVSELIAMTGEPDVQPGLLLHWLATVWRPLLESLGRGATPQIDRAMGLEPEFADAITTLAAAWTADASSQAPAAHRGERLAQAVPAAEQRSLAAALHQFPHHLAEVAGRWSGKLENVFFPGEGYRCRLDLDLHRFDETLGGTARVTFFNDGSGIEITLPEVEVHGELRDGLEPQVQLYAAFAKPVGDIELTATFGGGRLLGFYRGPRVAAGSARWKAQRWSAPTPEW